MRLLILLVLGCVLNGVFGAETPTLPPGVTNSQNPKDKPISPQEALKKITLPEGFRATLFAGEPDVMQPIAFDFDDRGRLWVVECFGYPDFKREDSDRVLIFEDKNGDGVFDTRHVFLTNGHHLSGIAIGFGGVWLTSTPNLIFIPDRDGNDVPDGKPEVLLDGWTLKAQHNMVNGLAWGPDGWLYGRHGITAPSLVGKPGTPDAQRTRVSCGIWRFHPAKRIFEVVVNGTTNPWGLDWDDFGQPFFSNNVIGHFWHAVPGAHYKRMFGEDFNQHVYQLMDQTADHLHWAGGDWTKGGRTGAASLGGGHSHAGCMVYLGGAWPSEYRNRVFMANIHGNRVLYDELLRQGSGYVAKHGSDFLMANDAWFRGVSIHYGPDGGVFVSDWNDLGECHDNDGAYRMSGRIYKITYGQPKPVAPFDLQKLSDAELVKLQLHTNDWHVRHARRILEERAFAGRLEGSTSVALQRILRENPDITRRLRALWTLHAIGQSKTMAAVRDVPARQLQGPDRATLTRTSSLLAELLRDRDQNMRWWAVQLLAEDRDLSPADLQAFATLARTDPSPMVRLSLASALQRLPIQKRWAVAQELLQHPDDAADQSLPLMLWYAIEPMVPADTARALQLARVSQIPLVRELIARRVAEAAP
jgi:putative membrane-bound dehydrogenase-like protein